MAAIGLPVYAGREAVVGPAGLADVVSVDEAVEIDGVRIGPEDRLVIDAGGCVRLRSGEVAEVLDAADRYAAAEQAVLEALCAGEPLHEAYRFKQSVVTELRR